MTQEKYQPTPEDLKLAEESMTKEQAYLSHLREYASAELTEDEQADRYERDGGDDMDGFFVEVKDEKLGEIKLFAGAESAEHAWWPFYPRMYLAEDILQNPKTGKYKVKKGALPVLAGGMGDDRKEETLKRMRGVAEELKGGEKRMSNLWLEGMKAGPFDYTGKTKGPIDYT